MKNVKNVQNVNYVKFTDEEILEMRKTKLGVEKIVENCQGLVKTALKGIYLSSDYSYDDKLQVGYGGILIAVKNFKIGQGTNFYTYAFNCVRTELYNVHRGYTRAKRGYDKENDSFVAVCSLDVNVGDEEKSTIADMIVDESADTHKQAFDFTEGLEKIYKILSPAQTYVFNEYFLQEKTMKEIAEAHGVTTTRVGNLSKQVMEKIQKNFTMEEFAEIIGLR